MRNAIVAGLREQEVDCTVEIGRFGSEIYAVMPTVDLDGNTYVQPVRFVGVRGSRWLVRVVISGDGALLTNDEIASGVSEIDGVIAKLVVNRGEAPIPPGERLALRSPIVAAEDSGQPNNPESGGNFNFGSFHLQL
jgi:hypothetical protein